jgi:uncharacterized protein
MSGLEMRAGCERCGGVLGADDVAYICSYECTYCAACYVALDRRCRNCGGELARRPRRALNTENACLVVTGSAI